MELWNDGKVDFYPTLLKNITIHEINQSWNKKIEENGL
jgi:hypothetical protein